MIENIIDRYTQPLLIKTGTALPILTQAPQIIWLIGLMIGFLSWLLIGFQIYTIGLFFFLIALFIIRLVHFNQNQTTEVNNNLSYYCPYTITQNILFSGLIFFLGINQSLASAFVLFSLIGIFTTQALDYTNISPQIKTAENKYYFKATNLINMYEIIIFITLSILFYPYYSAIAVLFCIFCWMTIIARLLTILKRVS